MGREESETVKKLREELSLSEKHLEELNEEYEGIKDNDPTNKNELKEIKKKIKEVKKTISQKKELIMILGDGEFHSEHGDIFDRFLDKEGEPFEDEVTRVNYPLHGIGLALFMEIREIYYKLKDR